MAESNNLNIAQNQYTIDLSSDTLTVRSSYSTEIKRKKIINIGNCSKFYLYILYSALFKLISIIILAKIGDNNGILGFLPVLSSYENMRSIYTYLSHIIFGTIFHFCFGERKKDDAKLKVNILNLKLHKIINEDKKITNFFIFLTCFGFVAANEFQILLSSLGYESLNFWSFQTIFTFLFMRKYFEFDIYKHHKCSIIFIFIICTILLFCSTFFPSSIIGNRNQYEFVKSELGSYFYIVLFIFLFTFLSLNYGFSRNYSKVLMQRKFVSRYILIIFIGITGLIMAIITAIIFYINDKDNPAQYFKELSKRSTWEVLRDVLIVVPIFLFSQFMQLYFEILVIYYLNPMYCLLLNNICFGSEKLILFLFDLIWIILHILF